MRPKHSMTLVIFLALVAPHILCAQGSDNQQTPEQVAYIRLIEGEVGYQRGDDNQARWSAAAINTPMMPGDFLYSNDRGRAEIQLGDGNFLRVGKQGYIGLLQSDDRTFQFKVASGKATLRLCSLDRSYEIDTPKFAFSVERTGEYRVDVSPNGETQITLHKGRGIASLADQGEQELRAPARLGVANGSARFTLTKRFKRDDWDRWNRRRDSLACNTRPSYLPPGVYGYETMSASGAWVQSQAYGPVWFPTVGATWQPYRLGRWVWVDPFGWTWVSYEPWGWVPYHYGRWAYIEGGWAWVPGPLTVRQRFCAALVAFLSGNEGGEWVGWFPLGPGEVYHPYVTREVYVARPVTQYVNYNYVTVVNRTEIYNSTTVVYNTRIVNQQIIENTQVVSHCDIAPSHETLYTPPVRVNGDQVVAVSNTAQPAPRPTEQVVLRDVRVRTPEVPTVRTFDEKLVEIHQTGRPVNPFQPPQPSATVSPKPGDSANDAKVAREKSNPLRHIEPHDRNANMPADVSGGVVPVANPPARGQDSARPTTIAPPTQVLEPSEDQARPHDRPPSDLERRVAGPPHIAPGQDQARPKYEPPQEVERRMSQPGAHGPGREEPKPATILPGRVNERRADEPQPLAPPHEQARPPYQPPQEVERRMNPPATREPGAEEPKSAFPSGAIYQRQTEESHPATPPHEQNRPAYQPPQDVERRMNPPATRGPATEQPKSAIPTGTTYERHTQESYPAARPHQQAQPPYQPPGSTIPGRESKFGSQPPQPTEGHSNRPGSEPTESRKPTQLPPTFPAAVRAQQGNPTQWTDTATPRQAPRTTVPPQTGNSVQPDLHNDRRQAPAVTAAPPPVRQTKDSKSADTPRASRPESQEKSTQDESKGKDKN